MEKIPERLILFDPHCNLCSAVVQYILKRDKKERFRFGSLFSKKGKQIKKHLSWDKQKNTIIYFEGEAVFTQSDAAIKIMSQLGGLHRWLSVLRFVPKRFRDYLYRMVAKYRYNVFGKRKKPFEPAPAFRDRFVDIEEGYE